MSKPKEPKPRVFSGRRMVVGAVVGTPIAAAVALTASYLAFATVPPVPVPPENPITESKRVLGKILFWDEQLSTSGSVSCGTCHTPTRGGSDNRIARSAGDDGVLNTPDDVLGSAGIIRSDSVNDYARDPIFGLAPQITDRAANAVINAAFAPELFWDGRARGRFNDPQTGAVAINAGGALENQAVGPIINNVEMAHAGVDWTNVVDRLERVRPLDLATTVPPDVDAVISPQTTYADLFASAFGDGAITARRIA
ncbi:MAG: cytochrome-c peroxidase, partial [bacterium]|nr:cytochrome-c peroxidase [bacterium]